MKQLYYFLFLTILLSACSNGQKNEWKLAWSEEFDSDTLNTEFWSKIPRGTPEWKNKMTDNDSLYEIKDGTIKLFAKKNSFCADDSLEYLTGGIFTKDKKSFQNGRLEICARFGCAKGFWPAIWMLPTTRTAHPDGGEIDIMEHLNFDSIVYQTIHTEYTLKLGIKDNPVSGRIASCDPMAYNIYAVELYSDSIVFFVNDKRTHFYPRIETDKPNQFPFSERDYYLMVDAQLGGGWVGPIDENDLPVSLEVDYVRFYTK
ncbi:MAG: glycoside hydrolase family 16 protein [Bacteroidales bacterium]|nr:glycoside hydrolase family 16 protein [Bacteroidales bacterium]